MHDRFDLLGPVHKGLRHALAGLCFRVGSLNVEDEDEADRFIEEFQNVVAILDSHSHDEDAHVHHLYERFAPETAARLEAEHQTLDAALHDIRGLVEQARRPMAPGDRAKLWYGIRRKLTRFTADYLQHLEREEGEAAEALWAHLDDAQLKEVSVNIRSSIPPATMMIFLHYMLPALSFAERFDILYGMKRFAPPEAYEAVRKLAQERLRPQDWEAIRAKLDEAA